MRYWLVLGALLAWAARQRMNADGMSYLDMARQGEFINGYWSPLYAALLAIPAAFAREPEWEFPLAHAVNFALFAGCLFAARRLIRLAPSAPWLAPFAYGVAGWAILQFVTIAEVTPDMLVSLFVLLAGAAVLRLRAPDAEARHGAMLGAILGLGYWAKTAMFPASVLLLVVLFVFPPTPMRRRRGIAIAALAFLAVSAPLVALVSRHVGRLTIGESGRLNYAWYVNGMQAQSGWLRADEHGVPANPPRVLHESPLVFEYGEGQGTYPLWYDPARWYRGTASPFDPKRLAAAVASNARFAAKMFFLDMGGLVAAAMALFWFGRGARAPYPRDLLWMVLWPAAVLAMYSCVHLEYRFLGGFLALFWMGLFALLAGRTEAKLEAGLVLAAGLSFTLPFALRSVEEVSLGLAPDRSHLEIARMLRTDRIATVGRPFRAFHAHLAGARVVAEIPDAEAFWAAPDREAILRKLHAAGARVLVVDPPPRGSDVVGWEPVDGAYLLRLGP